MYLLHMYSPFQIALKSKSIWVCNRNVLCRITRVTVEFAWFLGRLWVSILLWNPSYALFSKKTFSPTATTKMQTSFIHLWFTIRYISFYFYVNTCFVVFALKFHFYRISVFSRCSSHKIQLSGFLSFSLNTN